MGCREQEGDVDVGPSVSTVMVRTKMGSLDEGVSTCVGDGCPSSGQDVSADVGWLYK